MKLRGMVSIDNVISTILVVIIVAVGGLMIYMFLPLFQQTAVAVGADKKAVENFSQGVLNAAQILQVVPIVVIAVFVIAVVIRSLMRLRSDRE